MRKAQLANDYFYHIYNRGTDKRDVFMDEKDYFRFIHCLFEFNDSKVVSNADFRFVQAGKTQNYGGFASVVKRVRDRVVDIVSFCLMPNHFHLILKQLQDNGITKFMQKLGTGYTMYFNKKQNRTGALFQGTFKSILINKDEYFLPLNGYIHANPIEIIEPRWKEEGIKNLARANNFLREYRWSSYLDCIGTKNFPSVINNDFLLNYFQDNKEKEYQKYLTTYMVKDLDKIKEITFE